jgi:putative stress-induced transcription regulator
MVYIIHVPDGGLPGPGRSCSERASRANRRSRWLDGKIAGARIRPDEQSPLPRLRQHGAYAEGAERRSPHRSPIWWLGDRSPVLGPAEAEGALRRWSDTPAGARALVEARTLRAHFRVMLEQLERGRPIAASTLEAINSLLARPIGPGFLRPQQEPRSPLVQYERLRQSDEGRRVPSARQRRPG